VRVVVRFVAAKSAEHDKPQNTARAAGHPFWADYGLSGGLRFSRLTRTRSFIQYT